MEKYVSYASTAWCIFSNQIHLMTTCWSNPPEASFMPHPLLILQRRPWFSFLLWAVCFIFLWTLSRVLHTCMCLLLFLHIMLVRFTLLFCVESWSVVEWTNYNECLPSPTICSPQKNSRCLSWPRLSKIREGSFSNDQKAAARHQQALASKVGASKTHFLSFLVSRDCSALGYIIPNVFFLSLMLIEYVVTSFLHTRYWWILPGSLFYSWS